MRIQEVKHFFGTNLNSFLPDELRVLLNQILNHLEMVELQIEEMRNQQKFQRELLDKTLKENERLYKVVYTIIHERGHDDDTGSSPVSRTQH